MDSFNEGSTVQRGTVIYGLCQKLEPDQGFLQHFNALCCFIPPCALFEQFSLPSCAVKVNGLLQVGLLQDSGCWGGRGRGLLPTPQECVILGEASGLMSEKGLLFIVYILFWLLAR